jgi:hypothetical protein
MDKFLAPIFQFDKEETAGQILHFKLFELYMVYHIIWTVWYWGMYTLRITDVVLPLGLAQYIDITFMYGNNLPIFNAILISVLVVLAFVRIVPVWTYMLALFLMHFQYIARYSLGEISHGAHLTGMTLLVFALGIIIFKSSKERRRFIWGAVFFFVGISYSSAGISKLIGTGPTWIDGHHLWIWMGEKSIDILSRDGFYTTNLLQDLAWSSRFVASLILLSGLLIEVFGFLFWYEKTRPFIAILIIGMHVGILYSMNIRFDASIAQVLIIGFPWYRLFDYYFEKSNKYCLLVHDLSRRLS